MSSYTIPYVTTRTPLGERTVDVYSRLLMDRIVYLGTGIDDGVANAVIAQLLHLENDNPDAPIALYLNSVGGELPATLAIYDAMQHAKVLLHQGSAGIGGTAMDIAIQADDLRHTRDTVLGLISLDTGQDVETVERDSRRDRWFSAEEALAYGFVDRIVDTMDDVRPASVRPLGLGVRA